LQPGDKDHSPLPFKVNAFTGQTGDLKDNTGSVTGESELHFQLVRHDGTIS